MYIITTTTNNTGDLSSNDHVPELSWMEEIPIANIIWWKTESSRLIRFSGESNSTTYKLNINIMQYVSRKVCM